MLLSASKLGDKSIINVIRNRVSYLNSEPVPKPSTILMMASSFQFPSQLRLLYSIRKGDLLPIEWKNSLCDYQEDGVQIDTLQKALLAMIQLLHSLPRHVPLIKSRVLGTGLHTHTFIRSISSSSPPFPTIPTCPDPTCSCAPTPPMPEGLPIDHSRPLNATMAAYTQQVLIATGQADWSSRIEEDGIGESWGTFVRELKDIFGREGKYADVGHSFSIHITKSTQSEMA